MTDPKLNAKCVRKTMTKNEQKKYENWIDRCVNESKKRLTKWEEEFLEKATAASVAGPQEKPLP